MLLKLGKDTSYFDLLSGQASVAARSADKFLELARSLPDIKDRVSDLAALEEEGDHLTHALQNKLAGTFITPLDQEDLSRLSHLLDDITDAIEAIAARMQIYRLPASRPDLVPLVERLVAITKLTQSAIDELHHEFARSKTLPVVLQQMHDLENDSDLAFRQSLSTLFDQPGIEPIELIKWKEVYDRIEVAIDRCDTVANVVGIMALKYG